MTSNSQRSAKRKSSGGPRNVPAKEPRHAPARGKPGLPKGATSTAARRTAKSKAATLATTNNEPRKKTK
jgi:hypothetical protein